MARLRVTLLAALLLCVAGASFGQSGLGLLGHGVSRGTAGTSYYFATAGNDGNPCSLAQPCQSISKANGLTLRGGDSLLFNGGDTFSGNLLLDSITTTSAANYLTVDAYGTGTPTIAGGNSAAIKVRNMGYVRIQNLTATGAAVNLSGVFPNETATTTSTDAVIKVLIDSTATWYDHIDIANVTVTGGLYGIWYFASSTSATAAVRNSTIQHSTLDKNGVGGIMMYGVQPGLNFNAGLIFDTITVQYNAVTNNYGITSYIYPQLSAAAQTGNGIVLFNVTNALAYRNYVYNVGEASLNTASGGPGGIFFAQCTNSIIRENQVDTVRSPENVDGVAFDFDIGCSNSVIEYNYAQNCDGDGLLAYNAGGGLSWGSNQFRFNVLQNNGRRTGRAGIRVDGSSTTTASFTNNTIWTDVGTGAEKLLTMNGSDSLVLNNILSIGGAGATFGTAASGNLLAGNTYHVRTGASFSLTYNGVGYGSLAAMHTAGLEKVSATSYGAQADPGLLNGGGASATAAGLPSDITAYNITSGSAAVGVGYDPSGSSVNRGSLEFHQNALTGFDSGALEP